MSRKRGRRSGSRTVEIGGSARVARAKGEEDEYAMLILLTGLSDNTGEQR